MISSGYPYRYGEPIGWRASLQAEMNYGIRDQADTRYLSGNCNVYQEIVNSSKLSKFARNDNKAENKASTPSNSSTPMNVDCSSIEPEPEKQLKNDQKPYIDLTLEDEMGRMTLADSNVLIEVKNDPLNKLIPMPIQFVKQEPIDQPEMEIDSLVNEMRTDQIANDYCKAKNDYKGRYYESSISVSDISNCHVSRIVLSTSTLNGVFSKKDCTKNINLIAAPGATINALSKIAKTELIACNACKKTDIVICCGLNDFDRGHDLVRIKNDIRSLKQCIKEFVPNASCNFVKLPLPPVLCKLPDNRFFTEKDRTTDILMYNDFVMTLNDVSFELSLQDEGILDQKISGTEYWPTHDKTYVTGRAHDRLSWRKTEIMPRAMHLSDEVHKKFWKNCIEFYFDYACE